MSQASDAHTSSGTLPVNICKLDHDRHKFKTIFHAFQVQNLSKWISAGMLCICISGRKHIKIKMVIPQWVCYVFEYCSITLCICSSQKQIWRFLGMPWNLWDPARTLHLSLCMCGGGGGGSTKDFWLISANCGC